MSFTQCFPSQVYMKLPHLDWEYFQILVIFSTVPTHTLSNRPIPSSSGWDDIENKRGVGKSPLSLPHTRTSAEGFGYYPKHDGSNDALNYLLHIRIYLMFLRLFLWCQHLCFPDSCSGYYCSYYNIFLPISPIQQEKYLGYRQTFFPSISITIPERYSRLRNWDF